MAIITFCFSVLLALCSIFFAQENKPDEAGSFGFFSAFIFLAAWIIYYKELSVGFYQ